jgi:hypothetical protein
MNAIRNCTYLVKNQRKFRFGHDQKRFFNNVDQSSTKNKGTFYEKEVIETLKLSISGLELIHYGGSGDQGIDFHGSWDLSKLRKFQPNVEEKSTTNSLHYHNNENTFEIENENILLRTIRIIGQCKKEELKTSAKPIRELEGTLLQQMQLSEKKTNVISIQTPTLTSNLNKASKISFLGMIISHKGFTSFATRHFRSSSLPLALIVLNNSKIQSFLLNDLAFLQFPRLYIGSIKSNSNTKSTTPVIGIR